MSLSRLLAYVFLPRCHCVLCQREASVGDDLLCEDCRRRLRVCVSPAAPQPLDGLCAGLVYEDDAVWAMHRFKYQNDLYFRHLFAAFINLPPEWRIDCMIPVPLHPFKHWLRGYNQSEELCMELQARYPYPILKKLLRRTRYTDTQTRLSAKQRAKNVRGAFVADARVSGRSVLLVDDVTTTHATLIACAAALKAAGAKRVYAACACQAGE